MLLLSGLCLCVSSNLQIWRLGEDLRDFSEGLGFQPEISSWDDKKKGFTAAGSWRLDPGDPVCFAGCLVHSGGHYIIPGGLSLYQTRTAVPLWILGVTNSLSA